MGQIQYSEKYLDDTYEYRHVLLPPEVAKLLHKNRLLSELGDYEISEMFLAEKSGTMPDLVYSAADMTEFIAELDEKVFSDMCLSGSNDLFGEWQTAG